MLPKMLLCVFSFVNMLSLIYKIYDSNSNVICDENGTLIYAVLNNIIVLQSVVSDTCQTEQCL
jgi:hypothetical protein